MCSSYPAKTGGLPAILLALVVLGGCASPQRNDLGAVPTTPSPKSPKISVVVMPRLGLFSHYDFKNSTYNDERGSNNHLTTTAYLWSVDPEQKARMNGAVWKDFQTSEDNDKRETDDRLTPEAYMWSIDPILRARIENAVGKDHSWEFLLTSNDDNDKMGYEDRGVTIRIDDLPNDSCTITVDGKDSHQGCTWRGRVTNGKVGFSVSYGNSAPIRGEIPEDFLIVSLGDSFASGEGNPDRAMWGTMPDGRDSIIWMDERCHRSAWSGSIQAGLQLMKETLTNACDASGKCVPLTVRGAYTVANFACSGATIQDGVLGEYSGIARLSKNVKRSNRKREGLDYIFEKMNPLDAQTKQLHLMLNQSRTPAKEPNVVVISVGGNDVLFAPFVSTLVIQDVSDEAKQRKAKGIIQTRLNKLKKSESYRSIQDDLEGKKISSSLTVTIPRQSRGPSLCEPLKAAIRGR